MFVLLLFVVFMFAVMLSFIDEDSRESGYLKWTYVTVLLLLTLMVGLRPVGVDCDSKTYVGYYDSVDVGVVELLEPSFSMISGFARFFGTPQLIFIVYALLAIPLKGYALSKMSSCWFLSLSIWMNNYFILHECTQIRTAVAAAIFLYALYDLANGRRKAYLGLVLVAVFFHYSALLLLPLVVLGTQPITTLWRIVLFVAPLFGYMLYIMGIDPLTLIPIPFFQDKMEFYELSKERGLESNLNVFNLMAMFRLGVYYFVWWKCDEIYKEYKWIYLLLKILCISICSYIIFARFAALGTRSSELYGVVDILILPATIYAVRPEWVVRVVLAVVSIGLFAMNIMVNKLLLFEV